MGEGHEDVTVRDYRDGFEVVARVRNLWFVVLDLILLAAAVAIIAVHVRWRSSTESVRTPGFSGKNARAVNVQLARTRSGPRYSGELSPGTLPSIV